MSLLLFCNLNSRVLYDYHWSGKVRALPPFFQTVSRTRFNPNIFDYKCIVPTIEDVSNYSHHSYTFEDIMDMRSLYLKSLPGKKFVLYSGGIDSTAICVSILKNWKKEDYDDIEVLMTPQSYLEFPSFFPVLASKFKIDYCKNNLSVYKGTIVSGMQADTLFASNGWMEKAYRLDKNLTNMPYEKHIPYLLNSIWPEYGDLIFHHYRDIVLDSLFEIKTVGEFIYWFYYTQMYQKVFLSHSIPKGGIESKSTHETIFNFYNSELFEYWSLNNIHLSIPYKKVSFKKPLIDYIVDYTSFEEYRNKRKFPSYGEVHSGNKFNNGLTEDWEFLSFQDSLKYLKI